MEVPKGGGDGEQWAEVLPGDRIQGSARKAFLSWRSHSQPRRETLQMFQHSWAEGMTTLAASGAHELRALFTLCQPQCLHICKIQYKAERVFIHSPLLKIERPARGKSHGKAPRNLSSLVMPSPAMCTSVQTSVGGSGTGKPVTQKLITVWGVTHCGAVTSPMGTS